MNIVYVFNENYVKYAGISICSLLENNQTKAKEISFYLFHDNISKENKCMLEKMITKYGSDVYWYNIINITKELEAKNVTKWRGSYTPYVKILCCNQIKENIDRLLIIDADTLVVGAIDELQNMELKGNPCAMAFEGITGHYKKYIALENGQNFNAGVLLIDVKEWRQQKVEERFLNHLKTTCSQYIHPEQDAISIVLQNQVTILPVKYNYISQHVFYTSPFYYLLFRRKSKNNEFYFIEEVLDSRNDLRIIHYIDTFTGRPWHLNNINPFNEIYDFYAKKTPWGNNKIPLPSDSITEKIEYKLRNILPSKVSDFFYFICHHIFYTSVTRKYYKNKLTWKK